MTLGEKNLPLYLFNLSFYTLPFCQPLCKEWHLQDPFPLTPNPTTLPKMPQDKISSYTLGLVLPSAQNYISLAAG